MTGTSAAGRPVSGWRRWATSIEVAAIAGIVCAVAWSVSSRAEIARFYTDHDDGGHVGVLLGLMVIGTVAYLWFVGVVRSRLGARESRLVGTVFLGASVLLTGLMLVAASALAAPSILLDVSRQGPDPGAAAMFARPSHLCLSQVARRRHVHRRCRGVRQRHARRADALHLPGLDRPRLARPARAPAADRARGAAALFLSGHPSETQRTASS